MVDELLRSGTYAVDYTIWLFATGIAVAGAIYIIEQVFQDISSRELTILGASLARLIDYVPLICLLIVCGSIYLADPMPTAVSLVAKNFVTPALIFIVFLLIIARFRKGYLAPKYIDGASLLALGGAILRLRGAPLDLFVQ